MIAPLTLVLLALTVAPIWANHASFDRSSLLRHRHIRRRLNTLVLKRKIIGWGDSTTKPANVAPGSDDASCTCWHEVAAGEVCLGLIDKSSAGFTLDKFFKLNPSLNNDCSNLQVGTSYCVDDGANTYPSSTSSDPKLKPSSALEAAKDAFSQVASVSAATETGSCDADTDEDDEEDDYEEDDVASASAQSPAATSQPVAQVQKAAVQQSPQSQQQQQQQQQQNTWTQQVQQTWAATTSTPSPAAAQSTPAESSSDSSVIGQLFTGTSTYYYQNGVPGSCGTVSQDSAYVAAIYTGAEWGKSDCGRKVKVTNTETGAFVTVTVLDTCPTCSGQSHIDLSVAAFTALGPLSKGVLQTTWQFIS